MVVFKKKMGLLIKGDLFMEKNYNASSDDMSSQSDIHVFATKIKEFVIDLIAKARTIVIPKIIKFCYKLSILRDIEEDLSVDEHASTEYTLRIVNSANHAKQVTLLDLAVFTSAEIQECIIDEKTLKEMVIEFQVIKSKLFVENRSPKGNFLYEGALVEQITKNFEEMTPVLKKVYIDFFKEEIYQYHCSSILDISFEDLYDESWMNKVSDKLSNYNDIEIMSSQYPREIINKFKFIYMLIKIQEIKYDAITKRNRN